MDTLFSFKDSLQDGILVLPHLLSGFFFFMGILTSNIGMLCLALGHFIIVPSLSFFANNEWGYSDVKSIFFSLIPTAVLTGISAGSFKWWPAWFIGLMHILKAVYAFSGSKAPCTLFDTLNPYVWVNGAAKDDKSSVDLCYLSPEETFVAGGPQRRSPSGWTIHILFFMGFLIGNASRIYSMPIPTLKATHDPRADADAQEQLNIRVNNRKIITGTIMGLAIALLLILLYVRFIMSPCEDSFYANLLPMIFCFVFGYTFYTLLTDSCGIPASDILGLVQGFISPDAITNPIVCIGTFPGSSSSSPTSS